MVNTSQHPKLWITKSSAEVSFKNAFFQLKINKHHIRFQSENLGISVFILAVEKVKLTMRVLVFSRGKMIISYNNLTERQKCVLIFRNIKLTFLLMGCRNTTT